MIRPRLFRLLYKTHRYFARSTINSLVRRIKIKERFVPLGEEQIYPYLANFFIHSIIGK